MPANTPSRGFPYPLPSEPVAEGAQAIRNLAEKLDAQYAVCHCYLTSPNVTLVPSATETYLPFNATWIEFPATMFDSPTSQTRITIPLAGVYAVQASVYFTASATGYRHMGVLRARSEYVAYTGDVLPTMANGNSPTLQCFGIAQLAANDYLELAAYQTSGGNLNTDYSGKYAGLKVWRIA